MKRMRPSLAVTLFLFVIWLLLTQSLALGDLLTGLLLSLGFSALAHPFLPQGVRMGRPFVVARLASGALVEIVRSAFNVGGIILLGRRARLNAQFIRIPLDLRDPAGLAVLSCIINSTPGTVWAELLPRSHTLLLHVLDLHDADWWVRTIKSRYEDPLIEIFEGGKP